MTLSDLCNALINSSTVEHIENVLQELQAHPPGVLKWVPVGRENNRGTIESSADPGRSLVERVTNGIDAILEEEWVQHRGRPDCKNPREAASAWLGVPTDGLSRMSTRERQALADRVQIVVDEGGGKQLRTVTVRDFGIGMQPDEMPQTILSLSESNKVQKMYLAGAYGQGGSSTFAVSRYSVIASRKAGTDMVGVTLVRYEDLPAELYKHGRYVYLVVDGVIPRMAAPDSFPSGTLVRHIGYDLTGYPSPLGPSSVYGLLNRTLLDPVLPVWLEDRVHDYRRVIKGSRNALNGAVDEGDDSTRGPQLDHHMALYYVDLGHFGRIGIEYWVLQAPDRAHTRPTAAFVNPSKPIVLSVHGQSHAELPLRVVRKEAQLPYLAMRLIVHVDCNGLTPSAKRALFVSNREEARTGQVCERIEQEVVRALTSDDDLARLNQEARDRGLHERDEETEQEMRSEVARLLKIQGLDVLEAFGGVAVDAASETGDRPPTGTRRSRPELPPIEVNDPPTFIRFLGEKTRLYPEQRRYVRVESDAPPEYHTPNDPTRSRLNIIVRGDGVRIAGSTPIHGGRMRVICEALPAARLGTRGQLRLELSRPGQPALVAEQPFEIIERPPTKPGERRIAIPRFEIRPVDGPQDEMWATLGWPEDVSAIASSAEMTEGQLTIYYSTVFPKFQAHYGRFERQDPALGQSFVKRYEIWLAVHSLLLHQDQQAPSTTTEPAGQSASPIPEEALDVLERQERCRLATMSALFAVREVRAVQEQVAMEDV